jgi:hypothetical protein
MRREEGEGRVPSSCAPSSSLPTLSSSALPSLPLSLSIAELVARQEPGRERGGEG